MKPRITVATATSPDGTVLELVSHDGNYLINADGLPLMSTRLHHSEEELARLGCIDLPGDAAVLVGGLGLGYTLRSALDLLPATGRAVQVELVPEVVAWNRGPLAPFAGNPLADPRVELVQADVAEVLRRRRAEFSAILLDVDNGPSERPHQRNTWLYSDAGLAAMILALKPGGRVAIWAAADDARGFVTRLRNCGFEAEKHLVPARRGSGGSPHVIYVGRAPARSRES